MRQVSPGRPFLIGHRPLHTASLLFAPVQRQMSLWPATEIKQNIISPSGKG